MNYKLRKTTRISIFSNYFI